MAVTVVLFGKFRLEHTPILKRLTTVKTDSGLDELNYNEDSIEIIGSGNAVEQAIRLLAERDIIQPDFSRTEGSLINKRIKRLMREAKTSVFEGLMDSNKPHCWGQMPWRFITPLTLRKHMTTMITQMNACYECATNNPNVFHTCAAFSLLKVEHEKKWMDD